MTEVPRGSITFVDKRSRWNKGGIVADTLGRIGSLPTNILYGTPKASFQSPSEADVAALQQRFANVPVKGNIEVYMGHAPLFKQLGRLFQKERRTALFPRIVLGIPATFVNVLGGSFSRSNRYNPWTESASVFHPSLAIAANRVGMALTYDKAKRPTGRALTNLIPTVPAIQEFEASAKGMEHLDDSEKRQAGKILEPRFGLAVANTALGFMGEKVSTGAVLAIEAAGALVGHVHSRRGNRPLFYAPTSR